MGLATADLHAPPPPPRVVVGPPLAPLEAAKEQQQQQQQQEEEQEGHLKEGQLKKQLSAALHHHLKGPALVVQPAVTK